jgi:WD40 repeat protein
MESRENISTSQQTRRDELKGWLRFIRGENHILRMYPRLLFQQAANQPDDSAVALSARNNLRHCSERAWLQWINKPQRRDPRVVTFIGHIGHITCCVYSSDAGRLLSGSRDKTLRVWNIETGEEILTMSGHSEGVTACAFLPGEQRVVSLSYDNTIRIWDSETGNEITVIPGLSRNACAISPDGRRILSTVRGENSISVWSTETGERLMSFPEQRSWISCYAYSPDGLRILSGSQDGTLKMWDAGTGDEIANLPGHKILDACLFSPDSKRIVSASRAVRLLDAIDLKEIALLVPDIGTKSSIADWKFSPDSRRFISGSMCFKMWDSRNGEEIATLSDYSVQSCSFSRDGRLIVSGMFGKISLWGGETGALMSSITLETTDTVNACSFSPDGRQIVSGSNRELTVWEVAIVEENSAQEESDSEILYEMRDCAYSPDARRIVTGAEDGTLKVWNADNGRVLTTISAHEHWTTCCAYSPDGTRILSGSSDSRMKLWDSDSLEEIAMLAGRGNTIISCAYSPDGRQFVCGLEDGKLKVWDAKVVERLATRDWIDPDTGISHRLAKVNGHEMAILVGHRDGTVTWEQIGTPDDYTGTQVGEENQVYACAFSPDGRHILSAASDTSLKIWDVETGKEIATLSGHSSRVEDCAYSPDGRRIVSAASDSRPGDVRIWDARSRLQVGSVKGHDDWALTCLFSQDNRFVFTGSRDRTVIVWNVDEEREVGRFFAGQSVFALALRPGGRQFAAGHFSGNLYLVTLAGLDPGRPILTPVYVFRPDTMQFDSEPTAVCESCGERFVPPVSVLNAIRAITGAANLAPDRPPCLSLPAEAWEDPWLFGECPHCHQTLRFNPFIVDNRDRY